MADEELRRTIESLRKRVEHLERLLQVPAETDEPASIADPEIPAPPTIPTVLPAPPPPARPAPTAPPTAPAPPLTPLASQLVSQGVSRHREPDRAPAPPVQPHADPFAPPAARTIRREKKTGSPLEVLIGGKLAAWLGALVTVIAMGLLIKLGIDSGWWGAIPASVRCLLIAGFGGLLLAGGEWAMRRISRAASVGLFAARRNGRSR